ncbi:MAG: Ig-like domain-containing protein, partial [Spirochaetes bacterium]|nr:Ig-like domain-containing protein [Spirochaetota bacterium]
MKNTLTSYLLAAAIFISPAVLSGCFGTGDNADTVPPEIESMLPGNADEDVAINANITVVFSKPVINISNTTFTIERVGSFGSVPATVSYNDATRTATLNPAEDLDWDTIYVVN